MSAAHKVLSALSGVRIPLTDEKATQVEISRILSAAGIDHEREARLPGAGIIDFLFPCGLGMEVKLLKAVSARAIYRQLDQYLEHEQVTAIILASNRAMHLPEMVRGKPCHFLSLGRAWL